MQNELFAWIKNESIELDWQPAADALPEQQVLLQDQLISGDPSTGQLLLRLGVSDRRVTLSPSLSYLREIAATFFRALTQDPGIEFTREKTRVRLDDETAGRLVFIAPYIPGNFAVTASWIRSTWQLLQDTFSQEVLSWSGTIESYLQQLTPSLHVADRVCFHLVENKDSTYPFAFLATCTDRDARTGNLRQVPLYQIIQEMAATVAPVPRKSQEQLRLLTAVHRAGDRSALIHQWLASGEIFHPLRLTATEAWQFLKEIPIYESCSIVCRIPKWWQNSRQTARLSLTVGDKPASRLGLDALLDFRLEIIINGEPMTQAEIRTLLHGSAGLAMIKGKWVEVDPEKLAKLLSAFERLDKSISRSGLTVLDVLRMQWQPGHLLASQTDADECQVTQGTWLQEHLFRINHPDQQTTVDPGHDFNAVLRPYQQTGLRWLSDMTRLGLGACLADDMGLGKTIQIIALINARRQVSGSEAQAPTLIILPATLLANWTQELDRFAPAIRYRVLHPSALGLDAMSHEDLTATQDVLLTTYGMVERIEWLRNIHWGLVILDEAQAIKNPAARQTRAVKRLTAYSRLALTGTPIENRLSDLWSLFDFLNKGLLGTPAEFTGFCRDLKTHPAGYSRLRQVVSPFLLRRVKTDPAILSDLPEKVEMIVFSNLSRKQAALYQSVVDTLARGLQSENGTIKRKGLILATLLHLKQICNHPDLYHGQSSFSKQDSGKFERLEEICDNIREHRERVLVFTQFREMCEPLKRFLESVFGRPGLVLHGQIPVAKRSQIIDRFQSADYVPFLVLSLKAGGTGLNLTAANHVVHFDRWWNPAVENQATDRAFRIGQTKRVLVHAFVTAGTVEEKIDALIDSKRQLAADVIPDSQESFITEMDDRQLLDLIRLTP